jgi:phage-related protein
MLRLSSAFLRAHTEWRRVIIAPPISERNVARIHNLVAVDTEAMNPQGMNYAPAG